MLLNLFVGEPFLKALSTAPNSIHELMLSEELASSVRKICEKNNLHQYIPSTAILVGNILVGNIPVKNMSSILMNDLLLKEAQTLQVAQDIRREILAPVAHDLAAIQPQAEQNYAAILATQNQPPSIIGQSGIPPATS